MSSRDEVREHLQIEEKFVSHVYQDSLGFWTIGYGRLVDKRRGGGLTKDEANYLLDNDIERREAEVATAIPWSVNLDEVRRTVLIVMAFQMGTGGLLGFKKFLAAMKMGDWQAAYAEMLDSDWARQTPRRVERVGKWVLTGQWR